MAILIIYIFVFAITNEASIQSSEQLNNNSALFQHENDKFMLKNLFNPKASLIFEIKPSYIESFKQHENDLPIWDINAHDLINDKTGVCFSQIHFSQSRKAKAANAVEYKFVWTVNVPSLREQVCFTVGLNGESWFSTYTNAQPKWPLNSPAKGNPLFENAFVTSNEMGPVVEYLFLNSDGFALMLDDCHPWAVKLSSNSLCFQNNNENFYPKNANKIDHFEKYFSIKFRILASRNIKSVYQSAIHDFGYIKRPKDIPAEFMFRYPSWSFSSMNEKHNQAGIIEFANQIQTNLDCANHSLLNIEQFWQDKQSWIFIEKTFPNAKLMIQSLKKLGLRVSLELDATISKSNTNYNEAFIAEENVPKFHYEKSQKAIDLSNQAAIDYFVKSVEKFRKETEIDSFTFVDGKVGDYTKVLDLFTDKAWFSDEMIQKNPNFITTRFGEMVSRIGTRDSVVESAFKCQQFPIFVKLPRVVTTPPEKLETLIPNILIQALSGHQFIMSGKLVSTTDIPPNLYIRYVQAITFLPAMHFTSSPFGYNDDIQKIVKKFINLHKSYAPTMIELAQNWTQFGEPIIRPMWYADPMDRKLTRISDQFMVGSDLMVAPVLTPIDGKREIYFPSGRWRHPENKTAVFIGGNAYVLTFPLDQLPYYERIL